jgi:hypothetical protein
MNFGVLKICMAFNSEILRFFSPDILKFFVFLNSCIFKICMSLNSDIPKFCMFLNFEALKFEFWHSETLRAFCANYKYVFAVFGYQIYLTFFACF